LHYWPLGPPVLSAPETGTIGAAMIAWAIEAANDHTDVANPFVKNYIAAAK
jgi:hypothetical protein